MFFTDSYPFLCTDSIYRHIPDIQIFLYVQPLIYMQASLYVQTFLYVQAFFIWQTLPYVQI